MTTAHTERGFEKLGSVNDFAESTGLNPTDRDTLRLYGDGLALYRAGVASRLGLDEEEIHSMPPYKLNEQLKTS